MLCCVKRASIVLVLLFAHVAGAGASVMSASWYATGSKRADGARFNPGDPHIAAHRTLPFGTVLMLTNPHNGRTLRVVVRDRGPFIKGRHLDVTKAGAQVLGFVNQGVVNLDVEVIGHE